MAVEAVVARLPKVLESPTTLQYTRKLPTNHYVPKFSLTRERWEMTLNQPWLKKTDPMMPPYPYGANVHYPEANYGLYGGSSIRSGNKISKGRNKGKTLRKWYPSIHFETIRSEALDKELSIPVRARVMRTIEKCGGLDEYLTGDKPARIKELGILGWKLRYLIMKTPMMQAKVKAERQRLGLPSGDPLQQTFADVWNNAKLRSQLIAQQDEAWEKLQEKLKKGDKYGRPEDETEILPKHLMITRPSEIRLPEKIREGPAPRVIREKVKMHLRRKVKKAIA
jgi:large subunit ribosomal protein L28